MQTSKENLNPSKKEDSALWRAMRSSIKGNKSTEVSALKAEVQHLIGALEDIAASSNTDTEYSFDDIALIAKDALLYHEKASG